MENEDGLSEIDKIEELIKTLKKGVKEGDVYYASNAVKRQFSQLIQFSLVIFLDNTQKILDFRRKVMDRHHGPYGSDIIYACNFIKALLDKKLEKDLKNTKTFLSAGDLIKKAGVALKQNQDSYCVHLCDSAVETFFKEVFDIPSTLIGAGTVKFLSECMILDIPKGMDLYLKEIKNKVSQMNNQIKHKAYVPSRLDAINALKVTEEFYSRKNRFNDLTNEEKKKIQIGVGLLKK